MLSVIADWSQSKVHALDVINLAPIECRIGNLDIRKPKIYPSLLALVEELPIGSTLLLERNFESFIKENREKVKQLCKKKEIVILIVNPKTTAVRRRVTFGINLDALTKNGLLKDLSKDQQSWVDHNAVDVNVLLFMYQNGTHFNLLQEDKPEEMEKIGKINHKLMILRATETRDAYVEALSNQLPNPNALPDYLTKSLCVNKGRKFHPWDWNLNVFATIAVVVEVDRGCARLDFYTGHYGGNNPSMAASELKHWGWPNAQKNKATKQEYRQAIRWLFKKLKTII